MTSPQDAPAGPGGDDGSKPEHWLDKVFRHAEQEYDALPESARPVLVRANPAPDGPALGEEERAALSDALVPVLYNEWDDGAEVGKALDALAPVVAALLSSAREEGREEGRGEERERCAAEVGALWPGVTPSGEWRRGFLAAQAAAACVVREPS